MEDPTLARQQEMRKDMMRSVITEPLLTKVLEAGQEGKDPGPFDVIILLNEFYCDGMEAALREVKQLAEAWNVRYRTMSHHYCFARLPANLIIDLAQHTKRQQVEKANGNIIYRIWEDSDIHVSLTRSLITVKADAAQRAFQAHGEGIVWAVLDSGIQGDHPHFKSDKPPFGPFGPIDSLRLREPLRHLDFTPDTSDNASPPAPSGLLDRLGHGTHVAGIIGGYWRAKDVVEGELVAGTETRDPTDDKKSIPKREKVREISGVAPKCTLLSLKVIADKTQAGDKKQTAGQGKVSWVLLALDKIQEWNQHGKRLLVHGVNMSLGYDFNPRWFACGQSPICVEVNRMVKSGVAVVVSAGNAGYSSFLDQAGKTQARYSDTTISDPGNAELAITVGSTHKEMPHTYGVSYFSSRGPTGDGRLKPDLLAPGERIISCAAGEEADRYGDKFVDAGGEEHQGRVLYCEQSGTSMAAPHVSGAVAAFLSVRPEFQGEPERVREIFMANTIDLRRERCFQGMGLLDLMKVLQAV